MCKQASELLHALEAFVLDHVERRKPSLRQLMETVLTQLEHIEHTQRSIMAGVDDLKTAVPTVVQGIADLNTLVEQVIQKLKAGGLSDADAEALAVQLQGGIQAITDETAKLNQD